VVRDVFNEDFASLIVSGDEAWDTLEQYVDHVAPELRPRLKRYEGDSDIFEDTRVHEQLAKALDRKVWLPSGGSLVIDRTEAMTVIDVNTGKFTGKGGNLEETVTRNNLEAAEEIVRQLRLRDIGGMIVIDFIDMVLESNRELVLRRLTECLGRDRTRHQVSEVTSLGLVQMTRKRVGQGLLEAFSEPCEHCGGRGIIVHSEPVDEKGQNGRSKSETATKRIASAKGKSSGGGGRDTAKSGSGGRDEADGGSDRPASESAASDSSASDSAAADSPASAGSEATDTPQLDLPAVEAARPVDTSPNGRVDVDPQLASALREPAQSADDDPDDMPDPAGDDDEPVSPAVSEPVDLEPTAGSRRRGRRRAASRPAGPPAPVEAG
jgi:ribonuclease E